MKRKRTEYTEELGEKICEKIASGMSERQISKLSGMPSVWTMRRWKAKHPEFHNLSVEAREISSELYDDRRRELCDWLTNEIKERATSGEPFPSGVVESARAVMQELARSASMRDDSRFGDRKTVKMDVVPESKGMAGVYERIREALKDGDREAED